LIRQEKTAGKNLRCSWDIQKK